MRVRGSVALVDGLWVSVGYAGNGYLHVIADCEYAFPILDEEIIIHMGPDLNDWGYELSKA
jgi:hypothetical protein